MLAEKDKLIRQATPIPEEVRAKIRGLMGSWLERMPHEEFLCSKAGSPDGGTCLGNCESEPLTRPYPGSARNGSGSFSYSSCRLRGGKYAKRSGGFAEEVGILSGKEEILIIGNYE
jgi:hypothetical protein